MNIVVESGEMDRLIFMQDGDIFAKQEREKSQTGPFPKLLTRDQEKGKESLEEGRA